MEPAWRTARSAQQYVDDLLAGEDEDVDLAAQFEILVGLSLSDGIADEHDVRGRLKAALVGGVELARNLHKQIDYEAEQLTKAKMIRQSEADKVRQVAAVSGGRGNTGGYREAARELNIPERTVRRAYQTASIAQEAAVETGLDDNRSVLLEAAKERTPEAQTATIRRLAVRKTAPAEPTEGTESPKRAASVRPLRNLENISGGDLARWVKITAPNDRPRAVRLLRLAADLLEDELQALANGRHHSVEESAL